MEQPKPVPQMQVQEVTALQPGGFADTDSDQQAISEGDTPPVAMKDVAQGVSVSEAGC